jgi:hypothetical protein
VLDVAPASGKTAAAELHVQAPRVPHEPGLREGDWPVHGGLRSVQKWRTPEEAGLGGPSTVEVGVCASSSYL